MIAALRRAERDLPEGTWRVEPMPLAGEGLALARIVLDGPAPRSWVAKQLHPRLLRERAAYEGPLAGTDVAPRLVAQIENADLSMWLVLEDEGRALCPADLAEAPDEAASLLARVHAVPWRPAPRPPWPRPVHVVHHRRHLAGEWRIALERVQAGVVAGVVEPDLLPSPEEARAVLERAWETMHARGDSFVHGDIQAANLVRAPGGALRAVDWSQWGHGPSLLDVTGLAADMPERSRERFLDGYLDARGLDCDLQAWREALGVALPYRIFVGLGVLSEYALRGVRMETVTARLPERAAAWRAAREAAGAWR